MADATVLRLLTFRAGSSGPVLDVALRDEVLPFLESRRGLVDVFVGRHGTATTDERVIVTTWQSREAMTAALGKTGDVPAGGDIARLLPSHATDIEDARIDTYEIAFAFRFDRSRPARVLRVVHGEARGGVSGGFIEAVQTAAVRAARMTDGTVAFVLGIRQPASFAAVSVWPDWTAIERGTGASIRDTSAILGRDIVAASRAIHFEMLGSGPVRGRADGAATEAQVRSS